MLRFNILHMVDMKHDRYENKYEEFIYFFHFALWMLQYVACLEWKHLVCLLNKTVVVCCDLVEDESKVYYQIMQKSRYVFLQPL